MSTSTLVAWAEKKYKLFKKELENKEKQIIVTLRKDLEKVRDKVDRYGDWGSDRIDYIDTKLYKLTKAVDIKLNEFDGMGRRCHAVSEFQAPDDGTS